MANELKAAYTSTVDVDTYIKTALNNQLSSLLEDAGVFKLDVKSIVGLKAFTAYLNTL